MLVTKKFRQVHKCANVIAVILGSGLCVFPVLVDAMSPATKLPLVYFFLWSAVLGGIYTLLIYASYRFVFFRAGVPWPSNSQTISPGNYWKVARSYFWLFLKFILSAVFLAIYLT